MKRLTKLEGYRAAGKIIDDLIDEIRDDLPRREINRKSKTFKAGYFHGLVVASAMLALGEFPNIPENAAHIRKTPKR